MNDETAVEQPAASPVATKAPPDPQGVALGQRIIIGSMLVVIAAVGVDMFGGPSPGMRNFSFVLNIVAVVVSIAGSVLLSKKLGYNLIIMILAGLGMLIPLGNLLIMAILNERAMKVLRAAGWKVGFLGSSRPKT